MKNRFFYGWVIAACCTLVTMMNGGMFFTFSVFFKPVALDFGWTRGEFAANFTAMLVAYAPGAFLAGRLSDKRGPRPILVLAALLIGLGYIVCSRADSLLFLIAGYAVIGFGLGATLALPTATIQRWFVRLRGTMVGLVNAGVGIGGLVFAPLANYLIATYGWRTAYLVVGLLFGGAIALAALFLVAEPGMKKLRPLGYEGPEGGAPAYRVSLHPIGLAQALKLGSFRGMTMLYILNHFPAFFITSQLVPYVTDKGITAAVAAQGLGLMAGMGVVGRLFMSWLSGRIGWMRSITICFSFACAAIVWLMFVNTAGELYLFVVIYGFFWGSNIALLGGAVGQFFGLSTLSELLGFLLGICVLIGAISPWLAGLSFDLTGSYFTALTASAVVFLAAAVVSAQLKPPAG